VPAARQRRPVAAGHHGHLAPAVQLHHGPATDARLLTVLVDEDFEITGTESHGG
jgi:hypothetical protein